MPIDLDDAVEDDDFAASPAAAHRSDVRRGFDPGFAIDPDGDSDTARWTRMRRLRWMRT